MPVQRKHKHKKGFYKWLERVDDTFNGRTLFYLDKKQFIVLQNLVKQFIVLQNL